MSLRSPVLRSLSRFVNLAHSPSHESAKVDASHVFTYFT